MVKRRLVFQIAGYDPVDAEGHHRRFARGVPVFAGTWNVTAALSGLTASANDGPARWTVTTQAPNWRVDTTYVPLVWDDIIHEDYAQPELRRLGRFALALFDFVSTATVFRYFRAGWKYGCFFLFPVLYLIAFAAAGFFCGRSLAGQFGLQGAAHALTAAATGIGVFFLLLRWPGRRWRVAQALDDWIFSWDYLHGRRPDIEIRLERFAQELVRGARDTQYDEILVVGHSLGATFAVSAVARALERDPSFGARVPVCLLTVGSTIPKFTLHPDAVRVRLDVARVAASSSVQWAEFHARADPISFYKCDPAGVRVADHRYDRKPVIRIVRIKNMVGNYRRIQFKFMRVHHQFVMANERRALYDFYLMGCGPVDFERATMTWDGAMSLIGPDGSLADIAPVVPEKIAASAGRR